MGGRGRGGRCQDQRGNSKVRINLEKMSGTHICSERSERNQSVSGPDRSHPTPGTPGNGPFHMPAYPCLQPPPQGPSFRGQIRACSEGQPSKSRGFI